MESEEKKNNNLENQAKDYGKSALVEWIKMQIISKGGTSIEVRERGGGVLFFVP